MGNQNLKFIFLATIVVAGTLSGLYVLYESSLIFLSALIGVGLASLLNPIVTYLEKKSGISRFVAAVVLIFSLILLFSVLFFAVGTILFEQLESLKDSFPQIVSKWEEWWQKIESDYPRIEKALAKTQPLGLAQTTVSYLGFTLSSLAAAFTGLTLAVVIALFTAANCKKYHHGVVSLFSERNQQWVKRVLNLSGKTLRSWFVAQFIDMCVVCVLTTIGLWMVGVQYWALFGLLTGVLSILPYVGIVTSIVLSSLIVAVLQPEKIILLLVVYGITQQLEGSFILPQLMKNRVKTPAALLIFLMILSGSWLGVLGVFVTPPLLAIAVALYQDSVKV